MTKKEIKKTAHGLYVELVKLQREIISSKLKLLVILEGKDTAGKDGTIKSIITWNTTTKPKTNWNISTD